jgi:hypothetical protein
MITTADLRMILEANENAIFGGFESKEAFDEAMEPL